MWSRTEANVQKKADEVENHRFCQDFTRSEVKPETFVVSNLDQFSTETTQTQCFFTQSKKNWTKIICQINKEAKMSKVCQRQWFTKWPASYLKNWAIFRGSLVTFLHGDK